MGVKDGFDEDSFEIVYFALVEAKYCRIEFFVLLFGLNLILLLLFVVNLCCWLFKLLLFVVFRLLASFALGIFLIKCIFHFILVPHIYFV